MRKIALIPSYEPDYNLLKVVKNMKSENFTVVVVDDGSGEKYEKIFKECASFSKVISYDSNKGKGYALKKGLKYIKENYGDSIIVTIDSDGQHTSKDAIRLCSLIEKNKDTLVLGMRPRDKNVPLRSILGNSITRFVFKKVAKQDVYDTQTGLRAFSSNLIDFLLGIKGDRFEYEMNVLLNCSRENIKIKEVEIETIYIENNKKSHFNTIKDSYRIYKEIIKYSLSSIISFVIDYSFFIIFSIFFNISLSNVLARIISASFNFIYNRKVVFKSKRKLKDTLIDYVVLAVFILLFNTIILNLLVNIGINKFFSKILTEIILFFISYGIQKNYIF